jgi:hypothetical protein
MEERVMHRRFAAVIFSLLLVIWGCAGEAPPTSDQDQTEPAASQEGGEVFEDGFEEGDTEEWDKSPEGQGDVPADEEPSPSTSQPPSQ